MEKRYDEIIRGRLAGLREKMAALEIDYFLIPTADYHNSEYVAPYFRTREFFSGFTGSNGTLAVGMEEAGLWTDGRYFIQAEKELRGTGVDLYRELEDGVPTVDAWLADRLAGKAAAASCAGKGAEAEIAVKAGRHCEAAPAGIGEGRAENSGKGAEAEKAVKAEKARQHCEAAPAGTGEGRAENGTAEPHGRTRVPTLAFDGRCVNVSQMRKLRRAFADRDVRLVTDVDPAEGIWTDRPVRPSSPAFVLGDQYAGEDVRSKLGRLREKMAAMGAGLYVENKLDNLMWLFNLRGRDVECTPVALSFGVVTMDRQVLFIQEEAVTGEIRSYAARTGLELRPYEEVFAFLEDPVLYGEPGGAPVRVLFQPGSLSVRLWNAIRAGRRGAAERTGAGGANNAGDADNRKNADGGSCAALMAESPEQGDGSCQTGEAHDTLPASSVSPASPASPVKKPPRPSGKIRDIEKRSPVEDFKAAKNEVELRNIRDCYRDDSAAVCRFLYWLHRHVEDGTVSSLTELDAAQKMDSLRAQIPDYVDLSFETISAYGPNAAMMHYTAKEGDCARLRPEGMLLVDCGGQYLRGTTDVTRTMALGSVTDEMRRHYTLTAVGNLQLQEAVFLYGCSGRNVDILARQPLWQTFVDYKCGTGHGIGYLLSVHEGPQNIRWRFTEGMAEAVLEPGMIVSDEPGVYIEGKYGIRIETILEVVEAARNGDGRFLRFSPLTLVPLDPALLDPACLTPQTRDALNRYHARVFAEVGPLLPEDEREWLRGQTRAV